MFIEFKEDRTGHIDEGDEDPSLQPVKNKLKVLRALEAKRAQQNLKFAEDAKQAKQDYYSEVSKFFTENLKPRKLSSLEDFNEYMKFLGRREIVRPCFVQHSGTPKQYPCIVVAFREPSTELRVGYYYRFLYKEDMQDLDLNS